MMPRVPRRLLLAAPALVASSVHDARSGARAAVPPGGYNWRILRDGTPIGTHRVTVSGPPDARVAANEVELAVRLAGFVVYRYTHSFTETWEGTRLVGLRSRSDRNGTPGTLTVRRDGNGLIAEGAPGGPVRLPAEAAPLSWWDPTTLGRPLFEAFNGQRHVPLRQEAAGPGITRWRIPEAPYSESRYDASGTWLGYSTRGQDGSTVAYAA